jgi:hypothetical protein
MVQVLTKTVNLALKTESSTNKKTSDFKGDIPFDRLPPSTVVLCRSSESALNTTQPVRTNSSPS